MDDAAIDEMAAFEDHHWWFVGKRLLVSSLLDEGLRRPGLRVLDVGCGTGGVLSGLSAYGTTIGVDRSLRALHHSRARGVTHVAAADMDRLPFGASAFDIVLMLDVLEHFADEAAVLRDVRRLLRPDGTLLVSVPAFQALFSEHDVAVQHVRRYAASQLGRALQSNGFVVRRLTYTNVAPLAPAAIVRGLLPRLGVHRPPGTDFREHAAWVNRLLIGAYRLEAAALRVLPRLPAGLSVAAVAQVAGAA
jgi:2-polyprenyl-3-methyl-5-hydroxy-6-metoxy-1,4-benzoquinol methylase